MYIHLCFTHLDLAVLLWQLESKWQFTRRPTRHHQSTSTAKRFDHGFSRQIVMVWQNTSQCVHGRHYRGWLFDASTTQPTAACNGNISGDRHDGATSYHEVSIIRVDHTTFHQSRLNLFSTSHNTFWKARIVVGWNTHSRGIHHHDTKHTGSKRHSQLRRRFAWFWSWRQ